MISNKEKAIFREYKKLSKTMDKNQKQALNLLKARLVWGEKVDVDEIHETTQSWTLDPHACHLLWLAFNKLRACF